MSFIYRKLVFLPLLFFPFSLNAQIISTDYFKKSVDSIAYYFKTISGTQSNNEKLAINTKINQTFKQLLSSPGSFDYSFDTLKNVGQLYAPDKSFRIINWNIPLSDGTHQYFCYIQVLNPKQKTVKLFELTDRTDKIINPENSVLNAGNWYGVLYYKILKNKVKDQVYYTLLALQYRNFFITRKIIDVLFFDQSGNPVFGAPIFQIDNKVKKRIVFEYSAEAGMNLKYDEKLKMIVFDHLAPRESKYTGQYEYYGPDLTFDGIKFQKDHWVYKSNLDIRRTEETRR